MVRVRVFGAIAGVGEAASKCRISQRVGHVPLHVGARIVAVSDRYWVQGATSKVEAKERALHAVLLEERTLNGDEPPNGLHYRTLGVQPLPDPGQPLPFIHW